MKLNPFAKKSKNTEKEDKKEIKTTEKADVGAEETVAQDPIVLDVKDANLNRVIKNFYVSEKSSMLAGLNQYVFRVYPSANKSEIKKQVNKIFKVNVVDVKIMNMPEKRRDIGRHPGFKSGFKKAIVTLEKGQTIAQGQHKV